MLLKHFYLIIILQLIFLQRLVAIHNELPYHLIMNHKESDETPVSIIRERYQAENVEERVFDHIQSLKEWRSVLAKKGVTINSVFTTDIVGNPIGGYRQGIAHADSWGTDCIADLEKLYGYKDLIFHTSFVVRGGSNLSATTIDNQFPVAQEYGGETWRVNEIYLKKSLFNNHLYLKLGRLNGGNDFLQSRIYYNFMNNAFNGNPNSIFVNTYFFSYPFATWGAYLEAKTKKIIGKVAIYNADPSIESNGSHGCNFSFKSNNGILIFTEWSYLHNHEHDETKLPGNYRIGAFYGTGKKTNFLGGITKNNYGFYILLDQMLYRPEKREKDRGLTLFTTFLFAPINRNLIPLFSSFGFIYKGLFPERKKDTTSIAFAYGGYSYDLRQAEQLAAHHGVEGPFGNKPQYFEAVIELNHRFQIKDSIYILTDVQYIINPKGFGTTPNAWVIGTQIGINF